MNYYKFSFPIFLICFVSTVSLDNILREDLMYILIGEDIFPITLFDNQISKELISIMPLKSKLIQKSSKTIELSIRSRLKSIPIFSEKNTAIEVNKGDLLMNQGKKLILFNESSLLNDNEGEYIKIGHCENFEELSDKIEKNKPILLWNTLNYEEDKGKLNPHSKYNIIMNYLTWKIFTFFCFLLI